MPIIPILTAVLVGGIARTVLAAIGVGIVSFVGVEAVLSTATDAIKSNLGSGGVVAGFLGMMGIDRAISFVLSGFSIRITLSVLKSFRVL